jgi:hypothetical protein
MGQQEVHQHAGPGADWPGENSVVSDSTPESLITLPAEPEVLPLGVDGESVKLSLYSRQDSREEGFSATFKLSGNGNGAQSGELTVYTHKSEQQLSGLGAGQDQAYAFALPAYSSVRLGPDGKNGGWEKLSLRMPADLLWDEGEDEVIAPMVPVPDEDPATLWAIPVELVSRQKDSLVLTNATEQAVVVKLYLLDAEGHKLAAVLDPKLNPLLPGRQVLEGVDRFFPELIGLADFRGTIIARAEEDQQIWAMGVTGEELESLIIRRALNMNVDLEGLKVKMSQELEEIATREVALKEQMAHLDAVLQLAGGNGNSPTPPGQVQQTQSAPSSPGISHGTTPFGE